MRKRLFINMHYLDIGGAETALIGLLHSLDQSRVEVDLFLNDRRGELLSLIPSWINVLPEIPAYKMIERPMTECLRSGQLKVLSARLRAKLLYQRYSRRHPGASGHAVNDIVDRCVTPSLPSLRHFGSYDLAIGFQAPYSIVPMKVDARKKIAWLHTDYSSIDVHNKLAQKVWDSYDNLVSISPKVTENFLRAFPGNEKKIIEIENVLSASLIKQKAGEIDAPLVKSDENEIILLTIGRYSRAKRLESIPEICRLLVDKGLKVKWYIIGYGGEDKALKQAVKNNLMEDRVKLLGKIENPYPYIASCDWYVQPSLFEGKSIAVREAQILGKPVIITDYPTASSQVAHGIDGIIVPMEISACADAMSAVIANKSIAEELKKNISTRDFSNAREIDKLYSLL